MSRFSTLSSFAKNELWATLALRHAYGIGPRRAKRLVEAYGTVLEAVTAGLASPSGWAADGHVPKATASRFLAGQWREKARLEWAAIKASGCSFIGWGDERYPGVLRELEDAPLLLYYKGDASLLRGPAVGVVGARNCTREGIAVSAFFSRDLSRSGVAVVSGMARGIDRAAHLAGMEEAGRSIGVLGTGIDVAYPVCNQDIYALLGERGLLVSEFAPGTGPAASHFPIRNRLISGLSQGVLVVEAAGRSGSLITARLALEQNREVFAVPGHTMAAVSEGCRELIRQGAKAVFHADDVLRELAPLLTLEAQKALSQREEEARAQAKKRRDSFPRERIHGGLEEALSGACAVLPEGELPWFAPERPAARERASKRNAAERTGPDTMRPEPARTGTTLRPDAPAAPPEALEPDERRILEALAKGTAHIDSLARDTGMDVARASSLLTLLEVRGLVSRAPGMYYSLPEARHGAR